MRSGLLKAVRDLNTKLNAFTHIHPIPPTNPAAAAAAAAAAAGGGGGKTVSIKSNLCGPPEYPTTACSSLLSSYASPYTAPAVAAVTASHTLVGTTNMDEFGMGSASTHSSAGRVVSPFRADLSPGGSSGGAAVSVASRCVDLALGSDTGGSIRLPAAYNGIVGLKPTYGLVSRRGLVAYASSMDTVGPMALDLPTAAEGLDAMAGHDPLDPTSIPAPDAYAELGPLAQVAPSVEGRSIGLVRDALVAELDPAVRALWRSTAAALEDGGATVQWVDVPLLRAATPAYYVIAAAEAASNLARYDGIRYGERADASSYDAVVTASRGKGLGPEVRKRIMLGTHILSAAAYAAYYESATRVRNGLRAQLACALESVDALVLPTALGPPPSLDTAADSLGDYANDVFTVPANLAGLPAFSLPLGSTDTHLPLGIQLMGPAFGEHALCAISGYLMGAMDVAHQQSQWTRTMETSPLNHP